MFVKGNKELNGFILLLYCKKVNTKTKKVYSYGPSELLFQKVNRHLVKSVFVDSAFRDDGFFSYT